MKPLNKNRCLYCYSLLHENQTDFHSHCSKRFFGTLNPPTLSLTKKQLQELASEITNRSITIPGVQPKLSLSIAAHPDDPKKSKLTIVGLWGQYILKPQTENFQSLPENEDVTMRLAELAEIQTAEHTLLRTSSNELVYITKRFDRVKGKKIPMEDFCQLMEVPSEGTSKYDNGTMEKAGKTIKKYSSSPGLDTIRMFEISLFSFLIGNSDLHLKNLSIIKNEENQYLLSPAYDLISSNLIMGKDDPEQMALHLNGKKNNIRKKDFVAFAHHINLVPTIVEKLFNKYASLLNSFEELIDISFLPDRLKEEYKHLLNERSHALELR